VKRLIDTVVHKIASLHTRAYPADLTPDNRDKIPIDKRVGEGKTPDDNEIQLIAKENLERMLGGSGSDTANGTQSGMWSYPEPLARPY
jgi:hypothetical protein